jgi:hypothetical protein
MVTTRIQRMKEYFLSTQSTRHPIAVPVLHCGKWKVPDRDVAVFHLCIPGPPLLALRQRNPNLAFRVSCFFLLSLSRLTRRGFWLQANLELFFVVAHSITHSFTLSLSLSLSLCLSFSVQRRVLESEGCAYVPGFHVVFVGSLEKWQLFHQISLEELHRGF